MEESSANAPSDERDDATIIIHDESGSVINIRPSSSEEAGQNGDERNNSQQEGEGDITDKSSSLLDTAGTITDKQGTIIADNTGTITDITGAIKDKAGPDEEVSTVQSNAPQKKNTGRRASPAVKSSLKVIYNELIINPFCS